MPGEHGAIEYDKELIHDSMSPLSTTRSDRLSKQNLKTAGNM